MLAACGGGSSSPDAATAGGAAQDAAGAWGDAAAANASPANCPQGIAFAPGAPLSAGTMPQSIAAGDLDGDGRIDLVVSDLAQADVGVFLNRGNGAFAAAAAVPTGKEPVAIGVGDPDGDGRPDVAVADQSSDTVGILLNQGAGIFGAKVDYPTGPGPLAVAAGDLDGDGRPDLAVANFDHGNGNTVSVLLNRGDGTFAPKVDLVTGSQPNSGRAPVQSVPVKGGRYCFSYRSSHRGRVDPRGTVGKAIPSPEDLVPGRPRRCCHDRKAPQGDYVRAAGPLRTLAGFTLARLRSTTARMIAFSGASAIRSPS